MFFIKLLIWIKEVEGRMELKRNCECGYGLSFGGGVEVKGRVLVIGS